MSSVHPTLVNNPSNHDRFKRFRSVYTNAETRSDIEDSPKAPARLAQQGGNEPFYAGYYNYYLSAAQNPLVVQNVNNAASQLVSESVVQMVPSWTELVRMGIRSAQEQWISRRPSIFGKPDKGNTTAFKGDEVVRRFCRWA
ncbi:hypothetical protein [Vampirovibrio sp.]|uniref:hypothetical protein n=1 Tax=Vampirovibrio sp. TaxID=2717857 RepID=UPI003592FAE4